MKAVDFVIPFWSVINPPILLGRLLSHNPPKVPHVAKVPPVIWARAVGKSITPPSKEGATAAKTPPNTVHAAAPPKSLSAPPKRLAI